VRPAVDIRLLDDHRHLPNALIDGKMKMCGDEALPREWRASRKPSSSTDPT
jgi:hypothetical protein